MKRTEKTKRNWVEAQRMEHKILKIMKIMKLVEHVNASREHYKNWPKICTKRTEKQRMCHFIIASAYINRCEWPFIHEAITNSSWVSFFHMLKMNKSVALLQRFPYQTLNIFSGRMQTALFSCVNFRIFFSKIIANVLLWRKIRSKQNSAAIHLTSSLASIKSI